MAIPNVTPANLHPSIDNTRCVITTRWGATAYRPITVRNIESYYVDTALDNDADTWTVTVGDPNGDLLDLLRRDSEIRVQLFGVGQQGIDFLVTGMADDAQYSDGSWTLTGRDYSSLATDSTVRPLKFKHVRAWSIVQEQAAFLGFKNTSLAKGSMVKKLEYTDGSETYWEFWYRLYRREKMWIWCEPNGLLIAGPLNYNQAPTYYLGDARDDDTDYIKSKSIPVVTYDLKKSVQARLHEVIVYGHKGKVGFNASAIDNTMSAWIKKPQKIMLDTDSHTIAGAQKTGWNEIFEGKVGSVEFRITIPDPGFVLRQNRIARLNLPDIGLFGEFFIVGSRVQAGSDGFVQEIRLREKQYAVSRRVPADPKLVSSQPSAKATLSQLGTAVSQLAQMPDAWGDYFVKAAKAFCGNMDFNLFLATMLAICDQETGFQNERQNGGPGGSHIAWYPYQPQGTAAFPGGSQLPGTVLPPGAGSEVIPTGETRAQYEEKFANEIGGRYNLSFEYGVGPMQLTSRGLKNEADDLMKPNYRDEYEGGRWHPEYSITIAGKYLHNCVVDTGAVRDIDMWLAADAYNRGAAGAKSYFAANGNVSPYGASIKKKVLTDPGYLASVKGAVQAAQDAAAAARDSETNATMPGLPLLADVTEQQILNFFNSYHPAGASSSDRRAAIVYAAMFGYFHRDQINYSQGAFRMKDFNPPPNVPGNTDCSGFATWCYYVSGAVDPNGTNYNGQGYTGSLWDTGQHISNVQLRPGDLVFYGNPSSVHSHVAVYIGNNQIIGNGSQADPLPYPVKYRSDLSGFATYNV